MHKSKLLLASLLALALAAPAANATIWQDNSFHYWYGTNFAEPQIPYQFYGSNPNIPDATPIAKSIFSFTHASGYAHGGNFLNIDMLFSSPKDPVNNATGTGNTNQGAVEVYVVYRHNLSLNSFIASKPFEAGILRDVRVYFGADANTKNTGFAPEKIMPIGGIEAAFAVPGFLTIGVSLSKEFNTNGFAPNNGTAGEHSAVTFDMAPQINAAWHINLPIGALSFQGFLNVIAAKGKDGDSHDTALEVLAHPKFMYDVGTLFDSKGYEVGVGFQYWLNKFGNDHTKMPGCLETAWFVEAAIHL